MSNQGSKIYNSTEVGVRIKARRKELGYTQAQLASMMGFSPRLLSEIERGKDTVGIQKVLDLLTALGIDIALTERAGIHE